MEFIKIENLVKKYNENYAVNSISFDINRGELFGLLGPNGAGKSTTISILSGLIKPTNGSVYIDGSDIVKNPMAAKKVIGLVPQDIALYPTLTARENLMFWGRMYGLSGKVLKQRMEEVLNIVELSDRKNEKIQNYSGGMKRRINIAAALLHRPEILIMDEPTVGIDPQSRNHILETVKSLNDGGMTVIYTSHYMEEVEYLCSRIGIVDHGKLIAIGDKDNLKKSVLSHDKIEIAVSSVTPTMIEKIKSINFVTGVAAEENKLTVLSSDGPELLANLLLAIARMNVRVLSVNVEEPNLESVFLNLTGRALRD
jgi:daunorubicin resistance ABC transporter ATP-binding subunit